MVLVQWHTGAAAEELRSDVGNIHFDGEGERSKFAMRYNPLFWVLRDGHGGATISFKETFGYGLGCVFLVCDAPAILRVKIVVVVILAILVPGWVSQQDPGDFNAVLWYWYCGIGIVELVLWYFIIIIIKIITWKNKIHILNI